MALNWSGAATSVAEDGQSNNFYAVRIPVLPSSSGEFHYAKVRVFLDGSPKIEWTVYATGTKPKLLYTLPLGYEAPRAIAVSAFDAELILSGGSGEGSYVLTIPRIAAGVVPTYAASPLPIYNASYLFTDPQQMVLEGDNVFVVARSGASGGLFFLSPGNDSLMQAEVPVVTGIADPVGLLIDQQGAETKAYISTAAGQIYVVDISSFNPPVVTTSGEVLSAGSQPIAASPEMVKFAPGLGGPSGHLSWADDLHKAFYAPVVAAQGAIKRIDIAAERMDDELKAADPTVPMPWSVQAFTDTSMTVICDAAIFDVERGLPITGALALGLGLIPFSMITRSSENPATPDVNDGKANTSEAPGYYFSTTPNLAFGGAVSLLINHPAARAAGLHYYRVSILRTGEITPSKFVTNPFTDLKWNGDSRFVGVQTTPDNGLFAVRAAEDLWFNPFLGAVINTTTDENGHRQLLIEMFNASKQLVTSFRQLVFFDNTKSQVSLQFPRRGTATTAPPPDAAPQLPDGCGILTYVSKDDLLEFDLTAVHPLGIGTYSLSFYRGSTRLFTATGNLSTEAERKTVKLRSPGVPLKVGDLTGPCDIANITVELSTPSPGVINGYGWVNLGTLTRKTFTLAKVAAATHTLWKASTETPSKK